MTIFCVLSDEALSVERKVFIQKNYSECLQRMVDLKYHNLIHDEPETDESDLDELETDDPKIQTRVQRNILHKKPNVKWQDVIGLEEAKTMLKETIIMPIKFPHLFTNKRIPWKSILIFGVSL